MTDPRNPAPYCDPCREGLHALCEGWHDAFCACVEAECLTDLTDPEGDQ